MNDVASEERQILGTKALRRKRARRMLLIVGLVVVLPTLLSVIYYGFMASAQYASVTVFSVESGTQTLEGDSRKKIVEERDLEVARAYMRSREMLDILSEKHDFLGHFRGGDVDRMSRLSPDAGSEKAHDYFLDHVEVKSESKYAFALHVYAFTPERARELNEAIVDATPTHFERLSDAARSDVLKDAIAGVEDARAKLLETDSAKELELEVARQRYASATRALELAEIEAIRRRHALMVVAKASNPTEASRPRRLWNIATVLVTALALGGMFLMLGDFVREHAKF